MSNLVAVLAGGMAEAKRCVKHELQKARFYTVALAITATITLFSAGSIIYQNYKRKSLENEIVRQQTTLRKMPTVKADEMGTQCTICFVAASNVVLVPCNHLCICEDCFENYKKSEAEKGGIKCPMCRLDVDMNH